MSKILIIEDNSLMRDAIAQILNIDGYTILMAEDGPTGIAMARAEKPDLILLDLMMPYMPGDQVANYMRNDPHLCAIPIIILTAMNQPDLVVDLLRLKNVRDYLLKPANVLTLRQRVRAALGEPATDPSENGQDDQLPDTVREGESD